MTTVNFVAKPVDYSKWARSSAASAMFQGRISAGMFTEPSSPNTSPLTPVTQLRAPSAPRLPQVGVAPSSSSPLQSNKQQPSSTIASVRLPPAFASELPTSAAGPASRAAATYASAFATDAVLAHRQGFGELCSHQFCQHPWLNSRRRQVAEIDEAAQREGAILKALSNRKTWLKIFQKDCNWRQSNNEIELEGIAQEESQMFDNVEDSLNDYNQMQNIVLNLERKSKRDIVVAANDYQETQTRTQSELERLEQEVNATHAELETVRADVKLLRGYQERTHATRLLQIARLVKELEQLNIDHDDELAEVSELLRARAEKLSAAERERERRTCEQVFDNLLTEYPTSLTDMARENLQLREELIRVRARLKTMRTEVRELESTVRSLRSSTRGATRCTLFPELFAAASPRETLGVDAEHQCDVPLDIPRPRSLPL